MTPLELWAFYDRGSQVGYDQVLEEIEYEEMVRGHVARPYTGQVLKEVGVSR